MREKKGKVWRFSDWGLRRLAYKIQKAKNAQYILMNFELDAKHINEFKTMLDKDERVIRHLVIKRDEAITEDCPPPPEFHTLRAGTDDVEEEDDLDYDGEYDDEDEDEDAGDEIEVANVENSRESGIIYVEEDDTNDSSKGNGSYKKLNVSSNGRRKVKTEKVGR